jgi:hypothetical protein
MKALAALWQVAVDLIVGDDPKIAVLVAVVLTIAAVLLLVGTPSAVVALGAAVLAAGAFAVMLALEVRRSLAAGPD